MNGVSSYGVNISYQSVVWKYVLCIAAVLTNHSSWSMLSCNIYHIVGFFQVLKFCKFCGFDRFMKFKPSKNWPKLIYCKAYWITRAFQVGPFVKIKSWKKLKMRHSRNLSTYLQNDQLYGVLHFWSSASMSTCNKHN